MAINFFGQMRLTKEILKYTFKDISFHELENLRIK